MKLYVTEYSWMWSDLHLSLAECRVYAYIYGLTNREKQGKVQGYYGSKRHLAELLGLNAGAVKRVLDTLKDRHLIVYTDRVWLSVATNNGSVVSDNESVATDNESVVSDNSPYNPLYNNINNKNKASMQTVFDLFWKYFSQAMPAEFNNRKAATQMLFEARSIVAQKALVEAAQEGAPGHPGDEQNPYFFVQDFPEPQPKFLRGDEGGDIVQVKYNGAFKLCSRATMELFGLQWVRDW